MPDTGVERASQAVRQSNGIADAIARSDYFRRSPHSVGGLGHHKEWQHFVILTQAFDLLVNFSLSDEVRAGAPSGSEFPRIVLLLRESSWDGDVETFPMNNTRVGGGKIAATFGRNSLDFRDGQFKISVALQDRPITVDLQLTPLTHPAVVPTVTMLDGPPLHWVVVPRLTVHGTVSIAERVYTLDGVPAYHDHNWGHFLWGNDVAWEWGFVLPEDNSVPWSLTFVRLTNRSRTITLMQNLLLWKHEHLVGIFRDKNFSVHTDMAYLRTPRVFKVPRVMALLAPETPTDVPASFAVRAESDGDWVECRCVAVDVAQVLIPSETKLGVTIFNEVAAQSTVRGRFRGEDLSFGGRSILEFIRAGL